MIENTQGAIFTPVKRTSVQPSGTKRNYRTQGRSWATNIGFRNDQRTNAVQPVLVYYILAIYIYFTYSTNLRVFRMCLAIIRYIPCVLDVNVERNGVRDLESPVHRCVGGCLR